jgi:hypothetical protein
MDQYAIDEYSMINFTVGLLWYQAGFSFISLLVVYSIFKLVGNTSIGLYYVDKYLTPITGFKLHSESYKNMFMDLGFCFSGWMLGHLFLKKEFSRFTSVLVGLAGYYWAPETVKKYIIYIGPGLGLTGIIFRQLWYLLLGLGLGYAIGNIRLVKLP